MEGVFDILLILGIIGFGVFRQLTKSQAQKPAKKSPPVPFGMEEVFPEITSPPPPLPPSPSTETVQQKIARQKKASAKSKPKEVKKTILPEKETPPPSLELDTQSIEEIRKGVIWSEILNRKY